VSTIISDLELLFQRLDWLSVFDLLLVTLVFFAILLLVRDTKAMVLLRGVLFLAIFLVVLTSVVDLPAFSWLIKTTLPALLLAVPVIFAPEIRKALEQIGRAGTILPKRSTTDIDDMQKVIRAVVSACARLSTRRHGALIVFQRTDYLTEYILTGVRMDAQVTPELLLQVFYPNTPLHDGAVIISNLQLTAAAAVLPLSASGILNPTPERQMGLRHRAALGISEASDAIAVVVSEETGSISIAHAGRMIRRLDAERLENILVAFYKPDQSRKGPIRWFARLLPDADMPKKEDLK
jgi:diadenylate cyclase